MVHEAELCGFVRGAALISSMTPLDKHREMHYVMLKRKSSKNLCFGVYPLGGVLSQLIGGPGWLLRAFPFVG